MAKLRFALIGCGRIASKHYEALSAIGDAELVAVCDVKQERAKRVGEKLGLPYYLNYDEMLIQEQVDVVNILTPSGLHAEQAVDIANKYKKHIVCEKPMALTLRDADDMIEACRQNGVKLFVVKQNRYNLPILKLREMIEEQRFGKLVLGTIRVRWSRDQGYYNRDSWRGTWAMDGGVFANQASHHIDLLEWMMGEAQDVSSMTAAQLVDIEAEDTGIATIRFANGALGIVEATTATRPKDIEGAISVLGEKGTVEIGGFAMNEIRVWQFADKRPEDQEVMTKYKENPPNVYGFGHRHCLEHVVDCLINDKQALVDGLEGRKSLRLITALYESAETGKTVNLKNMSGQCRLGQKI
ncbi:Gfo/Idh/MocA family protein [Candidatus Margulisiibacteriota bacterium]